MDDTPREDAALFSKIDRVIENDLKFKLRLGIGDKAYASLKAVNTLSAVTDFGGAAATGAGVASSPWFAGAFFAKTGLMALFTTAATPVTVVIAAALATGGAYYGVTRLFGLYRNSRVDVIPKFLSSGIDLLGASLLDLMGALAIKVAAMDGDISECEMDVIRDYFVHDWGYNADYVAQALYVLRAGNDRMRLSEMTQQLSKFAEDNPDCDLEAISKEVLVLLKEIAEADGTVDEREEMAIARIEAAFKDHTSMTAYAGRMARGMLSKFRR